MKKTITFQTEYFTSPGENLYVELIGESRELFPMTWCGNGIWQVTIEIEEATINSYSYILVSADGREHREWGSGRVLRTGKKGTFHAIDRWHDRPDTAPFYSTAFKDCFFKRNSVGQQEIKRVNLLVSAPTIDPGSRLEICGSTEILGNWDESKSKVLDSSDYPLFRLSIDVPEGTMSEYKLIVRDQDGKVSWEEGPNRCLTVPFVLAEGCSVESAEFKDPRPKWKCAGVAIPVFSLRSEADGGIGDFLDLKLMADWASSAGMKIIQILPVNDTTMTKTWRDSYPYNAISTFALHPAYIRIDAIGCLDEKDREEYEDISRRLSQSTSIEYEQAINLKLRALKQLFAKYGETHISSEGYTRFFAANKGWLRPYATFCTLRDRYRSCNPNDWGKYQSYTPDLPEVIEKESSDEMKFWYFVQYHADKQLREARDYCHQKGLCLKGDIPIGISRTSVDAWQYPRLFNLDKCAGAPPDDFAILGQNWGFPTYNWEEMSKDGFKWWKERFMKMSDYFDIYRIDHLLGFFRIWEIPDETLHGLLGVFNKTLPLSAEEMKNNYGFSFDRTRYLRPYVTDRILDKEFGSRAAEVKARFFKNPQDGLYDFKDEFRTQKSISEYFSTRKDDERDEDVCSGLLRLQDDVLFLEDSREVERYHPRITPKSSEIYQSLEEGQRLAFDRLYEDYYYHRPVEFWRRQALWKLPPLIDSTGMLCCGEDLGMIPSCVPAVMEELKIFSLKVERMCGKWGEEFADCKDYPYYSVCTTSTHDMSGIRGWWESDRERRARYFQKRLGGKSILPEEASPWICDAIVRNHLSSPAMLCVLPLQDWISTDENVRKKDADGEQINDPSNPNNNWNYRMHLPLEQLIESCDFNNYLKWMIECSNR